MGKLNDFGVHYKTDKSSICHNYLDFYEEIFREEGITSDRPVSLLEIGVLGGASLRMWKDFFPKTSLIVGMDIVPSKVDGVPVVCCNAYKEGLQIVNMIQWDIVIDDGSHLSKDLIDLFLGMDIKKFPKVFIFEDCHAAFNGYTEEGKPNAFHFAEEYFDGFRIDKHFRFGKDNFSDSVTMTIRKP